MDKIPRQNPQCEGFHQDRHIFSNTPSGRSKTFTVQVGKGDDITLDGGIAHGITRGAEFNIFSDQNLSSDQVVGRFVVDTPKYFAEQTKSGQRDLLHIYADSALAEELYPYLQETTPKFSDFDIVQLEDEAHIAIRKRDEGNAWLRVIDPSLDPTRKGVEGYSCLMKNLGAVLDGISFYHWTRDNDSRKVTLHPSVIDNVEVEFCKLKYNGRQALERFSRDSDNLCGMKDNKKQVNLTFADNSDVYYGIKLINKSEYDLFPAIFYFDSEDLSICSYYQHPQTGSGQKAEAPLRARNKAGTPGSFTIGYGSGGAHPFSFNVPEGQDYDIGLVKIFLFTRPVNVSAFEQESPFEMTARKDGKGTPDGEGRIWGVIDIEVEQRREKTDAESEGDTTA